MQDYMNIMSFLMKHWDIPSRQGLSVEAQQAQEDVCKLQGRCAPLSQLPAASLCTCAEPAGLQPASMKAGM